MRVGGTFGYGGLAELKARRARCLPAYGCVPTVPLDCPAEYTHSTPRLSTHRTPRLPYGVRGVPDEPEGYGYGSTRARHGAPRSGRDRRSHALRRMQARAPRRRRHRHHPPRVHRKEGHRRRRRRRRCAAAHQSRPQREVPQLGTAAKRNGDPLRRAASCTIYSPIYIDLFMRVHVSMYACMYIYIYL
jgi:hypothetical protein